jgi:hypothetical protein
LADTVGPAHFRGDRPLRAQRREPNGRFQRLAAEREAGAQKIALAEKLTVLRVTWISYAKASRRSERLFEVFSNAMDLALRWSRDSRSSLCLVFTLSHPYLFYYRCNKESERWPWTRGDRAQDAG